VESNRIYPWQTQVKYEPIAKWTLELSQYREYLRVCSKINYTYTYSKQVLIQSVAKEKKRTFDHFWKNLQQAINF